MRDKFADSNILLYLFSEDQIKKEIAFRIFNQHPVITLQVIGENLNVCLRNFKFTYDRALEHTRELEKNCEVKSTSMATIESALYLSKRYKYSFWDCMILASALENNCTVVYSEDMQHHQVIEKKLKIVNPFI
jgi:predicted nucleic acid-binding protein